MPQEQEIHPSPQIQAPIEEKITPVFNDSVFHIKVAPYEQLLERLQAELLFIGVNDRPDQTSPTLFFSLKEHLFSAQAEEKRALPRPLTSFWLVAHLQGDQAHILVGKEGVQESLGQFTLSKNGNKKNGWELGGIRVDPSLLTRQNAKWMGTDLFLAKHAGKEGTERIDFDATHSIFVTEGSLLIWKDKQWMEVPDTQGFPLLKVDKIEDKCMRLTLWSAEGDAKCSLMLNKYPDLAITSRVSQLFHYLGAKTQTKWLFEVAGKRVTLSPGDWWLSTPDGWQLLKREKDIDEYVDQQLKGELFVVDGVKSRKGEKVLLGHVFSPSRTKVWDVEIPFKKQKGKVVTEKEEEEDFMEGPGPRPQIIARGMDR